MAWITPVTDRTQADVTARNAKGTLNASDLARIDGNLQVLAQELGVEIPAGKDWTAADVPRAGDYQRILDSTEAVKEALSAPGGLPELPELPLNLFSKYNTIEEIHLLLHNRYLALRDSKVFCGDGFYAGNTIGVI